MNLLVFGGGHPLLSLSPEVGFRVSGYVQVHVRRQCQASHTELRCTPAVHRSHVVLCRYQHACVDGGVNYSLYSMCLWMAACGSLL